MSLLPVDASAGATLAAHFRQNLSESRRGAGGMGLHAQTHEPIHFHRVGDLRERFRATRRYGNQQQLLPTPQQIRLLATGQRGTAQDLEHFLGENGVPAGIRPTKTPHYQQEHPQYQGKTARYRQGGRTCRGEGGVGPRRALARRSQRQRLPSLELGNRSLVSTGRFSLIL
jgi:hypothetical protein